MEGVELVFGVPGGAILPVYDALGRSSIKHVLVRHEQGAAHAADGYARVTGRVGVCLATSGPGATNLITGIANAYMDSVPMVIITGQVPTSQVGTDSFQEVDITGITFPVTKHNYLVKDPKQLPVVVKRAFHIASTGRPGPVLIDLPRDVAQEKIKFKYPKNVDLPGYKPTYRGHPAMVQQAARVIMEAERPVIYAGGGVRISGAAPELLQLAETISAPVVHTLMGLGSFPGDHPLFLGMLGLHGTRYANLAVTECDCLIAVGARFDDRVVSKVSGFAPGAKVIHIDIDPAEIGKNVRVHLPIVGDVKNVLSALLPLLQKKDNSRWVERIGELKEAYPLRYSYSGYSGGLKPQHVIKKIDEYRPRDSIVSTDVGQHQMWAAHYYLYREPRTFLSSGGLGTMGFGLPAAIGAQLARPDKRVVVISGDGSIQMNFQEMVVAVEHRLPLVVVVLNNRHLGMVRQWQAMFYNREYSASVLKPKGRAPNEKVSPPCESDYLPDFVRLAEAHGAAAARVCRPEQVEPALKQAWRERERPTLVECLVEEEENVYPMVPPGASLSEMVHSLA